MFTTVASRHRPHLAAAAFAFAMLAPFAASAAALPSVNDAAAWRMGAAPSFRTLFSVAGKDAPVVGTVIAADLGTDGIDELVTGSGFGASPLVRIVRQDGSVITSFVPFEADMTHGVQVAAGDVDGDGKAEIIAASGPGAPSLVRVLGVDGREKVLVGGYYPFGQDFLGGVNVAVGDTDGDGNGEIVMATGITGEPRIKALRGDGVLLADFAPFDEELRGGVHVTAGDLDGDGKDELIAAMAGDAAAEVRIFDGSGVQRASFTAISRDFRGGLNLASRDLDGDGRAEIIVAPNGGGGPHVHVFLGDGTLLTRFFAYEESFRGGVLLTTAAFAKGVAPELLTVPAGRDAQGRPHLPQYVSVDLSEQRMRMYEYGKLVKTVLVATGRPGFPTPQGDHTISDKPLMVRYAWNFGPGNPWNYDLGWVKWNLRFAPHIYIHNAPWRKVFGTPGSSGCVNVSGTDAEWIYNWASIGTTVNVRA